MANNTFQVKRTSTAGRTPNTTNSANSQYIAAGELALNMTDGILYSSNGSALIEIGANNVNQNVSNTLTTYAVSANGNVGTAGQVFTSNGTSTYWSSVSGVNTAAQYTWTNTQTFANSIYINNDKNIYFQTLNASAYVGMRQQSDDNFVFYSTNTAYGQRAIWSVFANSITSSFSISAPTIFNSSINFNTQSITANGTTGTAGQLLTSNGSATYWSSPGAASVNTSATYTWSNLHTFQANVSFTGNGIGISTNTGAIYLGGISDGNWKIGRNTGVVTKWRYTNNTIDIVTANSNLEGMTIGLVNGNSYFETGYLGTFIASNVTIGNTAVSSTINSTAFSGTANNTTYVNGKTEDNLNVNNALTANNSSYLGGVIAASYVQNTDSRTLSGNLNFTGTNTVITTNLTVINSSANVMFFAANGNIGVNNSTPTALMHISGPNFPLARIERLTALQTGIRSTFAVFHTTSNATMTDGFGPDISYNIRSSAGVDNEIGNLGVLRDGADNSGSFVVQLYSAGTPSEKFRIKAGGNTGIGNANPQHRLSVNGDAFVGTSVTAGNATINATVNSTSFRAGNTSTGTGGLIANVTTLLIGNNTINTVVTSAGLAVNGTATIANSSGVYTTGTMNAASYTTGGGYGTVTGGATVNTTIVSIGNTTVNAYVNSSVLYIGGNIVANSTGANNAFNLGGVAAASYVQNTDSRTLSGNLNFTGTNTYFTTGFFTGANVNIYGAIRANNKMLVGDSIFNANIVNVVNTSSSAGINAYRSINLVDTTAAVKIARVNGSPSIEFQQWDATISSLQGYFDMVAIGNTFSIRDRATSLFTRFFFDTQGNTTIGNSGSSPTTSPTTLYVNGTFSTSSNTVTLGTAGYVVANGNLGIGNSSPADKISINGTAFVGGNLTIAATAGLSANGGYGTAGQVLTSNASAVYWSTPSVNVAAQYTWTNTQSFTNTVTFTQTINATANNASYLGGTIASGYQTTAGLSANVATLTANNASYLGGTIASGYQTTAGLSANVTTLASNSATYANSSATNTFTIGTAAYHVANGWFGVGTSGPVQKFHLEDSGTVQALIKSTGGTAQLGLNGTSGQIQNLGGDLYIDNAASGGAIILRANAYSETLRLVANGSIGIGTSTPNAKLQVTGTANVSGNVVIGGITTFSANIILGSSGLSANGGFGTSGQVLHSNGTTVYWEADDQGVTSVATGNGMTGGTITTTGTVSVLANTGIVANTTGTFVNATYIGTISANNASFLGGTAAASYVQNTDSRTLSGNLNFSGANTTISGNLTIAATGELIVSNGAGIYANGVLGTSGQVLTSTGSAIYWSSPGAASVNVAAQYTWTNTQTFSNTITFSQTINGNANSTTYINGPSGSYYNTNNIVRADTLVQPYNVFADSSYTNAVMRHYSTVTTNRMLGRGKLINLTLNTVANASIATTITDGSADSAATVATTGGAAANLNLNFTSQGFGDGTYGVVYSSGEIWVHFYPGNGPSSLTARARDYTGTWTTLTVTPLIYFSGAAFGYKLTNIPGNYVTDLELTITPSGSADSNIAEIEYHGSRMGLNESPLVTVGGGSFYGPIIVNSNLTVNSATATVSVTNNTVRGFLANSSGAYINGAIQVTSTNTLTLGTSSIVANNGYTYLPNGLLMQWGVVLANSSTGAQTFPVAFTVNAYSVTATSNTVGAANIPAIFGLTKTGFTIRNNSASNSFCYWTAVGV